MGTILTAPSSQYYILVCRGRVQRYVDRQGVKICLMAETRDDAVKLAKWFRKAGQQVGPALIGNVHGQTLEGHIRLASDDGCVAACCVTGWEADGGPRWKRILRD